MRLACLLALLWTGAAQAAGCRLALALALDVSASVDADEYDLQRLGLAAALDSPQVRAAILRGAPGQVALAVYEWSGHHQQKLHLDWTMLTGEAAIDRAVALLAAMARSHDDFPTSVGQALGYGATLLERGPDCARRVIDLSGDGVNNYGFRPANAYRHFPFTEVVVNGLVILGDDPEVLRFYQSEVLHGTGAFLVTADGFADFRAAMTRKLLREIGEVAVGAAPAARRWPRG
ncbi:DUF1194 domain-containing protein [Roseovarius spongiae]|uniref:DUF1194 domain-containing protein n=1 Tax=Roseovarius spongiae TaxID=2320272 RepID=UPI001FEA4DBA|nr:DUF1194 domain-containing protein [Roseovarius spongiae]